MKVLDVVITEENYNHAVEANSGSCLVVQAIEEAYPHLSDVRVNTATIRVTDKEVGERYIFLTPPSVADTLLYFDQGWKEEKLPKKLFIRSLMRVIPIIKSHSGLKAEAERRAIRFAELENKEQVGKLTSIEKSVLTRMRNRPKPPVRPTSRGPVRVDDDGVLHGGTHYPESRGRKLHPNMLASRHRQFGGKTAQPSRIFRDAVNETAKEEAKEMAKEMVDKMLAERLADMKRQPKKI